MRLRLSCVLLLSLFLLCCTGAADRSCKRLRIAPGRLCALSLLLCALLPFSLPLGGDSLLGLAPLLFALLALVLCMNAPGTLPALPLALLCAALGYVLTRLAPDFSEPGLLLALASAPPAYLLLRSRRAALLVVTVAPLLSGLFEAARELYYFSYPLFAFGTPVHLDAQIAGAFLLAALWYLPLRQGAVRRLLLSRRAALPAGKAPRLRKWS